MKDGYLISNEGAVTVITAGKTFNVSVDHANYAKIIEALKGNDYTSIPAMVDVSNAIVVASEGEVDVVNGEIVYQGKVTHNSVTKRILDLMNKDLPFKPMVNYLRNLMQNSSPRAIEELYGFQEVGNLPLTEDGCFLAYKRVRDDYMDCYTGTIDNHIGCNPKMDRSLVVEDKNRTCAYGYHFCSLEYLSNFYAGSGHIMIVKINPRDVVSIPADYNQTKGRCCEYTVVDEYIINESVEPITEKFVSPVYNAKGNKAIKKSTKKVKKVAKKVANVTSGVKPSGQAFHNVRDKSGKFTKITLGVKPSGQAFHNVRDKSGKFTRK